MGSIAVNNNKDLLRHIMDIHYDASTNTVKPSAFETDKLKNGLSVSIKSKLDQSTKRLLLSQLKGNYQCDFEANCTNIMGIKWDCKNFRVNE